MIIANARLVGGADEPVDLTVDAATGRIADIRPAGRSQDRRPERPQDRRPERPQDRRQGASPEDDAAQTSWFDAAGRWLLPGFWDEHVHFRLWAEFSRRLDVSEARSAGEAARLIGAAAAAGGAGSAGSAAKGRQILVAAGFRDGLWPDQPHFALLDPVTGDLPTYVLSGDLHAIWLNSAALAQTGHAGHPTGLLREEDCFKITWGLADAPDDVKDLWVAEAGAKAAARGVTGIVDLDLTWALPEWQRREAAGLTAHRVECGVISDSLDQALAEGLRTGQTLGESGLLAVGPLKIIADGSLNTRTAWCFDPYPGLTGPGAHGIAAHHGEELRDLLRRATAGGLTPAVHAIGDRANAEVLDAFAAVGRPGRIEHAQLLRRSDLARFAPLRVTASVQPEHAMDDRDVAERHWPTSYERAFPLRSLLRAGARLAFGSDAPVAPLDPWVAIAAAVSRSRDGREPWLAGEAISVREAIMASSRGRFTPRVGEVGDLQLVADNPLTIGADRLRRLPVAATWLAGRLTHNRQ